MKEDIILIGGGGHCHSCIEVIESTNKFNIIGIIDQAENLGKTILGYKVIGIDDDIPILAKKTTNFFISVGQIKSPAIRQKIYAQLKTLLVKMPVIIASTAYVSHNAKIGEGTIIHHGAFVNANATVGKNCIINSKAIIEHDSEVGDFCHISTNAAINGGCLVEEDTFIGSGSILNQNIIIGSNSTIASGTIIKKSVVKNSLVFKDFRRIKR